MRLVLLIPVLRRLHRVAPLVASISAATPERHRVLFIADPGDQEEIRAVQEVGAGLLIHGGTYSEKCNAGIRFTSEPLIFLGADDLDFRPGWLAAATARLDPPVRVVGINDLGTKRVRSGKHSTHFLVARDYVARGAIDDPTRLLHEGYRHNWVDDEFVGTANQRGAVAFATDAIVEHLHPTLGKGEDDEVYRKGQSTFDEDREVFNARKHLWSAA